MSGERVLAVFSTRESITLRSKAMGTVFEGIKVLDFGVAAAAPMAARLLGDLGAEVIKVEPLEGDFLRMSAGGGDSLLFLGVNRSKRSLAINLKDARGLEIAWKLIRDADVMVENFRPGAMKRMGLDYESVSKVNPRIIYCSSSTYGQTGPMAHRRGGEPYAQAIDGMIMNIGNPDGPSQLVPNLITDYSTGIMAAFSIASALFMRERTGVGQEVTTSLFEVGTLIQESSYMDYLVDGKLHRKVGRGHLGQFPYGSYTAKDGDVFTMFGQDDYEWPIVCSILGIEHLLQDPRYDSHAKRVERRFELYPIMDGAFSKKTRAEWEQAFKERGLRCDGCLDYAEVVNHPQFEANEMIVYVDHPREGRMKTLRTPTTFKGAAMPEKLRHPPILGEHSEEVLAELGYTHEAIRELIEAGVVGVPTADMLQRKPRAKGITYVGTKAVKRARERHGRS